MRLDGRPELPFVSALAIREDRDGRVLVGAGSGLLQIADGKLVPVDGVRESVRSILETRDGALWLAIGSSVRQFRNGRLEPSPQWSSERVNSLMEDHARNLWIATGGEGLIRAGSAASYLEARTVLAIFEDREENLWVGTQDGLSRLSKSTVKTLAGKNGLPADRRGVGVSGAGRPDLDCHRDRGPVPHGRQRGRAVSHPQGRRGPHHAARPRGASTGSAAHCAACSASTATIWLSTACATVCGT